MPYGNYTFKQAKNYTQANRVVGDIGLIVIHTAEMPNNLLSAESLMNWAAGPQAPRASWHFAVDEDSITQSVELKDVAWHAPGANGRGIGIEICGRASWTAEYWANRSNVEMISRARELILNLISDYDIPQVFVDSVDLKAGVRGITTHLAVNKAFKKSTHTDPGLHFPIAALLI